MPEKAGIDMPEIVQERMGRAEQDINTLQWRVSRLEEWPPHIMQAQRDIEAIMANMGSLQQALQDTREEMKAGFNGTANRIDSGFKEVREAVALNQGSKSGFSRGLQIAIAVITIGAAGAGGAIWYSEKVYSGPDVAGMAAECNDGSYSTSEGRGACSNHGGVKRWLP